MLRKTALFQRTRSGGEKNDMLPSGEGPAAWRKTLFKMLPKHRPFRTTTSFRPIAGIRLLYGLVCEGSRAQRNLSTRVLPSSLRGHLQLQPSKSNPVKSSQLQSLYVSRGIRKPLLDFGRPSSIDCDKAEILTQGGDYRGMICCCPQTGSPLACRLDFFLNMDVS